jgi:hypothetical protein
MAHNANPTIKIAIPIPIISSILIPSLIFTFHSNVNDTNLLFDIKPLAALPALLRDNALVQIKVGVVRGLAVRAD